MHQYQTPTKCSHYSHPAPHSRMDSNTNRDRIDEYGLQQLQRQDKHWVQHRNQFPEDVCHQVGNNKFQNYVQGRSLSNHQNHRQKHANMNSIEQIDSMRQCWQCRSMENEKRYHHLTNIKYSRRSVQMVAKKCLSIQKLYIKTNEHNIHYKLNPRQSTDNHLLLSDIDSRLNKIMLNGQFLTAHSKYQNRKCNNYLKVQTQLAKTPLSDATNLYTPQAKHLVSINASSIVNPNFNGNFNLNLNINFNSDSSYNSHSACNENQHEQDHNELLLNIQQQNSNAEENVQVQINCDMSVSKYVNNYYYTDQNYKQHQQQQKQEYNQPKCQTPTHTQNCNEFDLKNKRNGQYPNSRYLLEKYRQKQQSNSEQDDEQQDCVYVRDFQEILNDERNEQQGCWVSQFCEYSNHQQDRNDNKLYSSFDGRKWLQNEASQSSNGSNKQLSSPSVSQFELNSPQSKSQSPIHQINNILDSSNKNSHLLSIENQLDHKQQNNQSQQWKSQEQRKQMEHFFNKILINRY